MLRQTSGKTYLTTELVPLFYEQQPQGKLGESYGRPMCMSYATDKKYYYSLFALLIEKHEKKPTCTLI